MTSPIALSPLAEDVYAAPQLSPEAMASVAEAGFKAVLNNRPDFEGGPDQPQSTAMQAAAEAAGLVYASCRSRADTSRLKRSRSAPPCSKACPAPC